jgi:hypothetical protein
MVAAIPDGSTDVNRERPGANVKRAQEALRHAVPESFFCRFAIGRPAMIREVACDRGSSDGRAARSAGAQQLAGKDAMAKGHHE